MQELQTTDQQNGSLAVMSDSAQIMAIISKAAMDPNVDVAKMSALLDLQDRVMSKRAEAEFNQALVQLMRELPRVKKDGSVAYEDKKGNSKEAFRFATWENIDSAIRPLLEKYGFSLSFNCGPKEGGGATVKGTLMHIGGHSKSAEIPLALDTSGGKNNIQGMGSTLSYGKRYTTFMLLNIVTEGEDDDGVRGGIEFIGVAEQRQIDALITETGSDRAAFLRFMEAADVENIQKKDLAKAMNALNAKKAKASKS